MEKSFVTVEGQLCVVCGHKFDTGALLLDRRMREKFEQTTITGWGMCDQHAQLREEGYVALVGVIEDKSTKLPNGNISPEGAYRTGAIAHLREHVFEGVFNVPKPDGGVCFCEHEVIEKIQEMLPPEERDDG